MIRILIILFTVSVYTQIYSQTDQQNPNVELPDFVITGTDVLSIQKAQKLNPEFLPITSQETLKPVYSAEQLEMKELSNPVKTDLDLFDSLYSYLGLLRAGAGFYTLPVAEIRYAVPFSAGIFEGYGGGKNIRSYVNNSGRYEAAAGLNLNFYTPREGAFLPGSQFRFHGDYGTSSFKFYGSPQPAEKREINNGNFAAQFYNLTGRTVTGGIKFSDDYHNIKEESLSEHYLSTEAVIKVKLSTFNLSVAGGFNRQMLTTDSLDEKHSLFTIRPTAGFTISRALKFAAGITYAKSAEEESFLAIYGSVSYRINQNFSLFGEYAPNATLYSTGYFLSKNRFMNTTNFINLYSEETFLQGSLKYEYDKFFQIDAGVRFRSSDRIPYFTSNPDGKFDVNVTDGKVMTLFSNLLFHRGPQGRFYGTVELTSAEDTSDMQIPYIPQISASLSYGYEIGVFDFHTTLYYSSDVFNDIQNNDKVESYVDLSVGTDLKIHNNFSLFFEVNNILNRANYYWRGYKEPPLDLVGGFVFRW